MDPNATQDAKTDKAAKNGNGGKPGAASPSTPSTPPPQAATDKPVAVTVGRTVHFHNDARFKGVPMAAVVTQVHGDKTINVAGWEPNGTPFTKQGIAMAAKEGPRVNVWSWPVQSRG